MYSDEYQLLKKTPEALDYRHFLAVALNVARKYDGSEASSDTLLDSLVTLEECIQTTPSLQQNVPQQREIEAALRFAPHRPKDIQDVLEIATEAWRARLKQAIEHPEESTGLVINRIEGVLLPPGEMPLITGEGAGRFKEARFEPRIDEVMSILKELRIFADDVILSMGEVTETQMREVSYVAIDIPRLNRMILVCNQVGEATFVINGQVPIEQLLCTSKENLQTLPFRVTRLVRGADWAERIKYLLSHEADGKESPGGDKINVLEFDQEQLKQALLEKYPTSADWMDEYRRDKLQGYGVEAMGRKIRFIARRLGIMENPSRVMVFIELGQKIYGTDDPLLQKEALRFSERSEDEWRESIIKKYPSFSDWFSAYKLSGSQRSGRDIDVDGRKLSFLALKLGFLESPYLFKNFFSLSRLIYGDDPFLIQQQAISERKDSESWKVAILKKYPTAADLFTAYRDGYGEGRQIEVDGRSLQFLAAQFGISRALTRKSLCISLAEVIYGAGDSTVQNEKRRLLERPVDEWRRLIVSQFPTSIDWMAAYRGSNGRSQGKNITIEGQKVILLARYFGIEAGHSLSLRGAIELGLKIYGEDDEVLKQERLRAEGDTEIWRSAVLGNYPTSSDWLKGSYINNVRRNAGATIKVSGRGVNFIASHFGFETPIHMKEFIELGLLLYGKDNEQLLEELDHFEMKGSEAWRALIIKQYPTSKDWLEIFKSTKQGRGINVEDRGLNFLASQFDIEGDPRLIRNFINLSRKIYGENDPLLQKN